MDASDFEDDVNPNPVNPKDVEYELVDAETFNTVLEEQMREAATRDYGPPAAQKVADFGPPADAEESPDQADIKGRNVNKQQPKKPTPMPWPKTTKKAEETKVDQQATSSATEPQPTNKAETPKGPQATKHKLTVTSLQVSTKNQRHSTK